MKKILYLIPVFVLLCAALSLIILSETILNPKTEVSSGEFDDGIINITITAVGDCTFASDTNSLGGNIFDTVLSKNNNDYSYFFRNVKHFFTFDDITIINFEGSMSERGQRADKEFAFRSKPEIVEILKTSSVEAANLANNHSRDYGVNAFEDTKKILRENGVDCFGYSEYAIREVDGIKVGLIGSSMLNSAGMETFENVLEALKAEKPDLIIASFHWGIELESSPDDDQIKLAHFAIDNGVDLVIGHHPHVLQGIEKYKDRYIIYSLGNFCFAGNKNPTDKDTMIFRQNFAFKNGELLADKSEASIIPCSISSESGTNNLQPTPLIDEEFERVQKKIKERSSLFAGIEDVSFQQHKK